MEYWTYYLEPAKYTDDFYHIGAQNAPYWLLKSTDGLILIDTGEIAGFAAALCVKNGFSAASVPIEKLKTVLPPL